MPYTAHSLNAPGLASLEVGGPREFSPPEESMLVSRQTSGISADPIDELRGAIGPSDGKVLVAGIDPIPEDRLPFNLRATVRPRVLVQCKTSNAVRESIAWAKRHGIAFCGRGGGHSYEGFSSVAGLVIDVGDINSIAVDAAQQTATIGAGCRLGNMAERLFKDGLALPAGTCAPVGIAGIALGGGHGVDAARGGAVTRGAAAAERGLLA